jgi:shikimate kinase
MGGMSSPVFTRIFLTGFMGAGKTTVGRILARRLGWRFYDVDLLVEEEQQAAISSLFSTYGELAYRSMESAAVRRIHREEQVVISLGGGALETSEVRDLVMASPDSRTVFLEAPVSVLVERCVAQDLGASRPVLQDQALLEARYDLRLPYYRNAHLTVTTESLTPEEVAATIHKRLAAQSHGKLPDSTRYGN